MSGLGKALVDQGVITDADLEKATTHAAGESLSLTQALVALGLATEDDVVRGIAAKLSLEFTDLDPSVVSEDATSLLTKDQAEELGALPISFTNTGVLVAIADPGKVRTATTIQEAVGMPVSFALAIPRRLTSAIEAFSRAAPPDKVKFSEELAPSVGERTRDEEGTSIDLDSLLEILVKRGGSDLHLTAGIPPAIRHNGDMMRLDEFPVLDGQELQKLLYSIMTQRQREAFENDLELDLSYAVPGLARFRVNIFQQRDVIGSVMRLIPFEITSLESLGMPEQLKNFAYEARGFVLVTGPTGSGKSTTLASIIDLINDNRASHIMTVEDPIEFLHRHKKSVVNQREVGTDTHSFTQALKHVLRQDPDVILVGEMRDLETISIALTAAETGHLVFGTLHTQDAPQTVDRIIDVFPPHQQEQIRVQLAGALKGVVCQTLCKTADGMGRAAATEIMIVNSAISNLIREGKTHQIYSMIQAGGKHGMMSMDQSLANLVKSGRVTYEEALEKANRIEEFQRLTGRDQ